MKSCYKHVPFCMHILIGRICGGRSTSRFSVSLSVRDRPWPNVNDASYFEIEGQTYDNQMISWSNNPYLSRWPRYRDVPRPEVVMAPNGKREPVSTMMHHTKNKWIVFRPLRAQRRHGISTGLVTNLNLVIFQLFQKICWRGNSLHSPLLIHELSICVSPARLDIIGTERQDSRTPDPYQTLRALINNSPN